MLSLPCVLVSWATESSDVVAVLAKTPVMRLPVVAVGLLAMTVQLVVWLLPAAAVVAAPVLLAVVENRFLTSSPS
jgi:hypothetical protein